MNDQLTDSLGPFPPDRRERSSRSEQLCVKDATRRGGRKRIINESTHVVQLVVKPASVADRLAGLVPPPEGRGRRLAVGAAGARPPRRALQRQFWKREHRDITPVTLPPPGRSPV